MTNKQQKEIEVKVKLNNASKVKKLLENLGVKWSAPKSQIDTYYKLKTLVKETLKPGSYILRIRRNNKSSFTLKALTGQYGVWEEYETEIENPKSLEKILAKVGFVVVLTLHKKRVSGKYKKFNLELDQIKELGNFLEAEAISHDGKKLQQEITQFFLKIGLSKKN